MEASRAHLIYLSSFEYPSRHGHPLHALSMARAFSHQLGDRFLFVVGGGVRSAPLAGIQHASPFGSRFSLLKLFHLRALGYGAWLVWFLTRNAAWRTELVVFTNDLKLAAVAGLLQPFFGFKLVSEVHGSTGPIVDKLALRASHLVVYVTTGLATRFGHPGIVLPNAVDVDGFTNARVGNLRAKLGIPETATVVGYVGRFRPMQSDKGVNFMIDALAALPSHVQVLLVGGTPEEIEAAKGRAVAQKNEGRLTLVPLVPFDERYPYFLAADILAYVPEREDQFLREETSPMKLFEYMAARRPIIASDLPALREAVGEGCAHLIPAGSQEAFVRAVKEAKNDTVTVERAYARVRGNTWNARAKRIIATL